MKRLPALEYRGLNLNGVFFQGKLSKALEYLTIYLSVFTMILYCFFMECFFVGGPRGRAAILLGARYA